jgi:protein phosphatase
VTTDHYSVTNIGLRRKNNEDYLMVDEELCLYLLADGMGGHLGGERASQMALNTIKSFFEKNKDITEEEISKLQEFPDNLSLPARKLACAIMAANKVITDESEKNSDLVGMGTTLVAMHGTLGDMYLSHVGDSRIYLLRDGTFKQMTEDHSVYNEEKKRGLLTPEQLDEMPFKKRLVRAIGHMDKALVDIKFVHAQTGDVFLLCSDGLTDMVADEEIAKTLSEHKEDLKEAGDTLVEMALKEGGIDNVSIVIVRVDDL